MQSDFDSRGDEQLQLIKHKLSFLPEIKNEVQRYLDIRSIRHDFSELQKALSHLNGLPSTQEILEKDDSKQLVSVFGKFEMVKAVAQLEILTIQSNLERGLNGWNIGIHGIRDHSGLEISDFQVDHVWAADILPSFEVPARVMLLHQPPFYRIVFGMALSPDKASPLVIQLELPSNWTDPLENMLGQIDLFYGAKQFALDGIGYELHNLSWASESVIRFANPFTSPFEELEGAFYNAAEMVIKEKGQKLRKTSSLPGKSILREISSVF